MSIRHTLRATLLLCLTTAAALPAAAQTAFPPDSVIQRLVDERVQDGRVIGIVVGIRDAEGNRRFFTAGRSGTARALDEHSIFEIGSITKVFTGVLLADMARRGDVALDDPVSKYLPASVTVPAHGGTHITLGSLSVQNSGLPRLPNNMRPSDPLNPYADYTEQQLYEFLSSHQLRREPGAQFEYSNLGVGLLGHVLALRAGRTYEELVRQRILEPLGMEQTAITLTPALRAQTVVGHNAIGDSVPLWDLPALAGAGALRSSAADMLKFAAAAIRKDSPLHESIALSLQPRAPAGQPGLMIGLGWVRLAGNGDTIVMHNGGTGGFRSFLGIAPASGRAVILLTNSGGAGSDDLALHLLNPAMPLATPRAPALDVPQSVLQSYVGTYQLAPQFSITVTLRNGVLFGTPTAQPPLRLWPVSETEFAVREVDARITFQRAPDGSVTGLVLRQNGRETPGTRVRP